MRLGILGTMVWDRIEHPAVPTVERWGGIAYSLAAAAAALPDGWSIRPIMKVGRDLAAEAGAFLDRLPGVEGRFGCLETDEANNRVHLRYRDHHHRQECLTGGVPAWRWDELAPRLQGLDALYVNLISGFELELDTARRLGEAVGGRLYADLHSLVLGVGPNGQRVPRPVERADEWLDAFRVVQVNESELALVSGGRDPWDAAEAAVGRGVAAVMVTRGPDGATIVSGEPASSPWDDVPAEPRRHHVPMEAPEAGGDPTGCGDVWGARCFVELTRGASLEAAARAANRTAALNVRHQGADGLYSFLMEAW